MLKLCSKITITQAEGKKLSWEFNSLVNCTVVSDVSTLTDTCEIELPRKISWEGHDPKSNNMPISRGDHITIHLGYDDDLKLRFSGVIKNIDTKNPVKLTCEDDMFQLKQLKPEKKGFKSASLKEVLQHIMKGSGFEFKLVDDDLKIGDYRVSKDTIAEELQEMKDKSKLSIFFRKIDGKSVLYAGLTYPFDNRNKIKFIAGKSIISESFEYLDRKNIKAKVSAVSFNKKHEKIEVELGDKDGKDIINIRIDGLEKPDLTKYAQQSLDAYKADGLKGSFEAFGEPLVGTVDMLEIHTAEGISGTYLVKKNEIKFGTGGYRQKIELGPRINT